MAQIVASLFCSHTPFCYTEPERWEVARGRRHLRDDVPIDDLAAARDKRKRIDRAFSVLRETVTQVQPDIIVTFGDDQLESFDFGNMPSFLVYANNSFAGSPEPPQFPDGTRNANFDPSHEIPSDGPFAAALLAGLIDRGFDPSYSIEVKRPEKGMTHSVMYPANSLTDLTIPIVPILLNCYYPPQVTGQRSFQIGRAIGEVIRAMPAEKRVLCLGSGGLWHTPGTPDAYLDEDFDRCMLAYLAMGDAAGMADHFDAYVVPIGDSSQASTTHSQRLTHLIPTAGPQGGTREICNWIAAAAAAGSSTVEIIDYLPVYASPIGIGFAQWVTDTGGIE